MIKLKDIYEIKLVRPLRLNEKGKQLVQDYNKFNSLIKKFGIDEEFEGNQIYSYAYDLEEILSNNDYSLNGVTNIELLKKFLSDYRYGEINDNNMEDFNNDLNYLLQYFS